MSLKCILHWVRGKQDVGRSKSCNWCHLITVEADVELEGLDSPLLHSDVPLVLQIIHKIPEMWNAWNVGPLAFTLKTFLIIFLKADAHKLLMMPSSAVAGCGVENWIFLYFSGPQPFTEDKCIKYIKFTRCESFFRWSLSPIGTKMLFAFSKLDFC